MYKKNVLWEIENEEIKTGVKLIFVKFQVSKKFQELSYSISVPVNFENWTENLIANRKNAFWMQLNWKLRLRAMILHYNETDREEARLRTTWHMTSQKYILKDHHNW